MTRALVAVLSLSMMAAFLPQDMVAAFQPHEDELFFTGIPHPESMPFSTDEVRLEMVRQYGDQDEGLVFGRIVGLTVSATGTLAVLDQYGWQIWIVDTETGEGKAIGGCEDGPGEFRRAFSASFSGDTLLVWDFGRASLVRLTLEGEEIDRAPLSALGLGAAAISGFHIGSDGRIPAGLELLPYSTSQEDRYSALYDRFGGTVTRRELAARLGSDRGA